MKISYILTLLTEPNSAEELGCALKNAAREKQQIRLIGRASKNSIAGPLPPADITISTRALNRLLKYEPRDLTVSVEAGMRWKELNDHLAQHRQMIPLDPPFSGGATVGGVVAANSSGPRRRLYGTARDMVIGMTFVTLEGKQIQSGGMVVKNVAGLDMGKLMIGSFGTLAAMASVNFRVFPMPDSTRTFRWRFSSTAAVIERRDAILQSVLQPMAVDLQKNERGFLLLVQAGGNAAVLKRYSRELNGSEILEGQEEREIWREIRQFTPHWLLLNPEGAVLRISTTLAGVRRVMETLPAPAIARAGNGVCYGYFQNTEEAQAALKSLAPLGKSVIEHAPPAFRESAELWPSPGNDFAVMKKVKAMFDPDHLLNSGRMYGRI